MCIHVYYLHTHKDKHLYIDCYIIVISLYINVKVASTSLNKYLNFPKNFIKMFVEQ